MGREEQGEGGDRGDLVEKKKSPKGVTVLGKKSLKSEVATTE